jgi:RNA polymerase sigma-70 factor (ECF subfamily)
MDLNAEIFLRLVRPSWERLHLVAGRYASGSDDARDLVQEALLRAWRNFSPGEERTYGRAWLFVILRNVAAEWRRTARRRIRLSPQSDAELTEMVPTDLTEPFAPAPNLDEERFREFLDERLAAALDGLEPMFREVIVMSVAGGLNYREIGEVLDCPVGTVMSRMARARRMLREQLADVAVQRGWVGGRTP